MTFHNSSHFKEQNQILFFILLLYRNLFKLYTSFPQIPIFSKGHPYTDLFFLKRTAAGIIGKARNSRKIPGFSFSVFTFSGPSVEKILHTADHGTCGFTHRMFGLVYAFAKALILFNHLGTHCRNGCYSQDSCPHALYKAHCLLIHHIKPPDCAELFDGICPPK